MEILFALSALPAWLTINFFIKNSYEQALDKPIIKVAIIFGIVSLPLAIILSMLSSSLLGVSSDAREAVYIDGVLQTKIAIDIYLAALAEEISKFVPLAIFVLHKSYFRSSTIALIMFAIAGFTFAVPETFLYSLGGGGAITAINRFVMGLFLHASLTALLGYVLYALKRSNIFLRIAALIPLLAVAGTVHFIYNFGIYAYYSYPWMLILSSIASVGISGTMFVVYYLSVKQQYKAHALNNTHRSVGKIASNAATN